MAAELKVCPVLRIAEPTHTRSMLMMRQRRGVFARYDHAICRVDQNLILKPALPRRLLLFVKLLIAVLAEISEKSVKRSSFQL